MRQSIKNSVFKVLKYQRDRTNMKRKIKENKVLSFWKILLVFLKNKMMVKLNQMNRAKLNMNQPIIINCRDSYI